ncbi:MAG: glycosyltransferase family 4 protein, partial [Patescibacteria group bacterium]
HYREQGKAPRDFLYGMQAIDESRLEVSYVNAPQGPGHGFMRRFFFPIEKLFSKFTKLGWPLEIFFLFRRELRSAKYVFCVNDPIGFAVLFWKRLGMIPGDVYLIAQSAHERCREHFRIAWFTRRLVGWLLRAARGVFVLAPSARQSITDYFHVPSSRVHEFVFGGDADFWTPGDAARESFVLSIGNDFNRDYRTLVRALPDGESLTIITTKSVEKDGKDITIVQGLPNETVRDYYRRAALVVIPSIPLVYESSGLSSALQAVLCGAPLIMSDAPTMRDVFTEKEHCLFYGAGNPDALRAVLRYAKEHPEDMHAMAGRARAHVLKNRTPRHAAESLERVIYANT